tara:strand:+ start:793 stop:1866 length:1074 start_codon:yes stop_codon:yes gene_type:complete
LKIGIVSAEPSGDLLGSKILSKLKEKFENIEVIGVGGGPLIEHDLSPDREMLEIMGLVDPILNFQKITNFRNDLIENFSDEKIDIFIGIDAPDFNFEIHKKLQKKGIKTIHVVCPSVWAWRPGRVKKFKYVDYMLCLFPFELEFCANVNKQAFCIGHPLLGKQSTFECNDKENIICIMPGSRRSEIQNNLQVMIDGFNQFNFEEKYKAIIPIYKEDDKYLIQHKIQGHKHITLANVESSEILKKSKAAVVCSGTATLEALLAEVPTTVIYKTNWFNHLILKNLMKSEFVSIPNIVADEEIFLELIQTNASSENIAHDLNSNMADYEFRKEMIRAVKAKLEKPNLDSFCNRLYEDCRS